MWETLRRKLLQERRQEGSTDFTYARIRAAASGLLGFVYSLWDLSDHSRPLTIITRQRGLCPAGSLCYVQKGDAEYRKDDGSKDYSKDRAWGSYRGPEADEVQGWTHSDIANQ